MSSLSPTSFKNSYDPAEGGIESSKITGLAEEVLHQGFRTRFPPKVSSIRRTDEKSGNISLVLRAGLLWNDADKNSLSELPDSVVLKLPTATKMKAEMSKFVDKKVLDQLTEEYSVIEKGHNAECNAYDLLENVPNLKIPKHFGHSYVKQPGNYDGMLILEDLTDSTAVVDFMEGLSLQQTYSAVENLAALHAYSLTTDHWKSKTGVTVTNDMLQKYMKMGVNTCHYFQRNYPDIFKFKSQDLALLLNPNQYRYMTTDDKNAFPVILHGDFWINNFLFECASDGTPNSNLVATIDWQNLHRGTIGEDLARVVASSLRTDLRRNGIRRIIGRYYETLTSLMLEKDVLVPFSMLEVEKSYRQAFPYMAVFMIYMSAVQLDGAYAGQSTEQKDALAQRVSEVVEDALAESKKRAVLPEQLMDE